MFNLREISCKRSRRDWTDEQAQISRRYRFKLRCLLPNRSAARLPIPSHTGRLLWRRRASLRLVLIPARVHHFLDGGPLRLRIGGEIVDAKLEDHREEKGRGKKNGEPKESANECHGLKRLRSRYRKAGIMATSVFSDRSEKKKQSAFG